MAQEDDISATHKGGEATEATSGADMLLVIVLYLLQLQGGKSTRSQLLPPDAKKKCVCGEGGMSVNFST